MTPEQQWRFTAASEELDGKPCAVRPLLDEIDRLRADLSRLRAARLEMCRTRSAVTTWMAEQGARGRLRHNDEAPAWADYLRAVEAWDGAVVEILERQP